MTLHVHLLNLYSTVPTEELRARLHSDIRISEGPDLVDAESIQVLITGWPKVHHLDACANLRAVVVPFAGVPKETTDLLQHYPGVALHSVHSVSYTHLTLPTSDLV